MTKQLFLNELSAALHGLSREERYRTLSYYDELIDEAKPMVRLQGVDATEKPAVLI